MREQGFEKTEQHICAGILAHVDAGKTTLAESILYLTGTIRKMGRVDHRDAFLDTHELERNRGITIFSKQAELMLGDRKVTLLDTPGHVDFSAEMKRTLQVLDYGILVISGAEGVQAHVETLWRLLARYEIPTFLFINKMDQNGTDKDRLMEEIKRRLDSRCIDFSSARGVSFGVFQNSSREQEDAKEQWEEEIATSSEELLEAYLEGKHVSKEEIASLIQRRQIFPCFFGSALKLTGVKEFLEGMEENLIPPSYPETFGARVFKISRDSQGTRLTHIKITGGSLRVKTPLTALQIQGRETEETPKNEKIDQIRIYSGAGYRTVDQVEAGAVCAVTGLTETRCGDGLGIEEEKRVPVLEPVLTYRIELPAGADINGSYRKLKQLEEEEPELHIVWDESLREIHVQVMGDVQIEILKSIIQDRYGLEVEFGAGSIVYKETIAGPVEGIGHYEPLRHYAEVHLLMEPLERGSGLEFESRCSEDVLDRNWQRLVLTHLEEKKHRGVLMGAEITDMKLTLITGKAHLKHTEGGDFRQATYRAVRNGLMKARSILLEPVYEFRLEVPADSIGRAMGDLQRMEATFGSPQLEGEMSILTGTVPVSCFQNYSREVAAYTRGRGHIFCTVKGYEPCHNGEQVMAENLYYPEADVSNTPDSVFCSHGAGFVVPWDMVEAYAHLDGGLKDQVEDYGTREDGSAGWLRPARLEREEEIQLPKQEEAPMKSGQKSRKETTSAYTVMSKEDRELADIFERTYGPVKRRSLFDKGITINKEETEPEETEEERRQRLERNREITEEKKAGKSSPAQEEYLLVDGYNIIFAWDELNALSKTSLEAARQKLMDILCNYQGFRKIHVILVFDAYKVKGNVREIFQYHNIHVVYTQEAETADQYIEKTVHEMGRKYQVTVATSDGLEQVIILGAGAKRMSARELYREVKQTEQEIRQDYIRPDTGSKSLLIHQASQEVAEWMENKRLGK